MVYYNGDTGSNVPLLIYILQSDDRHRWICRHFGDITWQEYNDSSLTSDTDSKNIKSLLEQLSTPHVTIDLDNCATYNPKGNSHKFDVEKSQVTSSGYYQFTHTKNSSNGEPFTVKSVVHGQGNVLDGIQPSDKLTNISGHYYGDNPSDEKKLLLVGLLKKNGSNKYVYYSRPLVSGGSWTKIVRTNNQTTALNEDELKPMLDALKKAHFPDSPTTTIVGSSIGTGTIGAGITGLVVWKGPALLSALKTLL
ncbi:hypothetical protein BEWA_048570 [Theileria equi strain WA]|uniref:Uncharacterized protein n=1 Tax=Theileria equi strain WA TaxID=1537102 RepID=L1LAT3_THEEQ|nr:hypothetical protein BEWA_048570 [Theileria equi strain WA]EKX72390.1 hypothetical protein BEWA_048570 [Theileria equi strain WA]|eukprot:XP_004831842.1 hypothetical protein BEWA_048570 [Theileria equi strain WA]